ncbi:YjfB family protein [Paenibacillus crassostreae]|uniref:YjfB family protein n=1 Tax=Paenibacillus crassostreae TaxID=1763538 RepID=UPI0008DBB740|nr:YjfB family protein [Paenibacillus crassostreae]AOZ91126.1 putative motility protein [Paenibacillus crassostreae]
MSITSIGFSQSSLKQAVSLSILKMSNDQATVSGNALTKMMEQSVQPNLGGTIDIKA